MKYFLYPTIVILILWVIRPASTLHASAEGDYLRQADNQLNTVFQNTLKLMPTPEAQTKIIEAQRSWIHFRDAEIALNGTLPGASGNTLKMLQTSLTEARSQQLIALGKAVRAGNIE